MSLPMRYTFDYKETSLLPLLCWLSSPLRRSLDHGCRIFSDHSRNQLPAREAKSLEAEYNMSQTEDERKLPELQMDPTELEELRRRYVELIGFVPPRIQARTDLLARLDPELLSMQEALRAHAMYPECFDTKTPQLMLFAMLLVQLSYAAHLHARAAHRAGATW